MGYDTYQLANKAYSDPRSLYPEVYSMIDRYSGASPESIPDITLDPNKYYLPNVYTDLANLYGGVTSVGGAEGEVAQHLEGDPRAVAYYPQAEDAYGRGIELGIITPKQKSGFARWMGSGGPMPILAGIAGTVMGGPVLGGAMGGLYGGLTREEPSFGSVLGSTVKGAAAGYAGGQLGSFAGNVAGDAVGSALGETSASGFTLGEAMAAGASNADLAELGFSNSTILAGRAAAGAASGAASGGVKAGISGGNIGNAMLSGAASGGVSGGTGSNALGSAAGYGANALLRPSTQTASQTAPTLVSNRLVPGSNANSLSYNNWFGSQYEAPRQTYTPLKMASIFGGQNG